MSIKFYTEHDAMPDDSRHIQILFPFWGTVLKKHESPSLYNRFTAEGRSHFDLVADPQAADYILAPASYHRYFDRQQMDRLEKLANLAQQHGKPLLVFQVVDEEWDLPFPGILFRPSIHHSRKPPYVMSMPGWALDLTVHDERNTALRPAYSSQPVVGFCGNVIWNWQKELYWWRQVVARLLGRAIARPGLQVRQPHKLRKQVVALLQASPHIDDRFILRRQQYGQEVSRERAQEDYIDNILGTDYTLCIRGLGNFSFRFYETLAAGRIPILINTDCELPFDWLVDWRDVCVWVEAADIKQVDELVADFHASQSEAQLRERQAYCREIWDTWVSPYGFFAQLHRYFAAGGPAADL